MSSKTAKYLQLVQQRKKCRVCSALCNPGQPDLSKFDSEHIGPWSKLHGDLDAELMIVGQDWGDVRYYERNGGCDDLNNPTMKNLQLLLRSIGITAGCTTYSLQDRGLFFTNSILCLKTGGMQAQIDPMWVENCRNRFLRPSIELIQPAVVVGLGVIAFNAILDSYSIPRRKLSEAIQDFEGIRLNRRTRLFAAYHCGAGSINRNRSLIQQRLDWKRIKRFLKSGA